MCLIGIICNDSIDAYQSYGAKSLIVTDHKYKFYTCTLSCTLLLQVGRMKSEVSTDLSKIGLPVRQDFEKFAKDTGRKLHLEIEPGTFLVANVGSLVSTVQDIVSTGSDGHTFIKVYTSQYTTYYLMQHSIKAQ
jgi:hypothetical protein